MLKIIIILIIFSSCRHGRELPIKKVKGDSTYFPVGPCLKHEGDEYDNL